MAKNFCLNLRGAEIGSDLCGEFWLGVFCLVSFALRGKSSEVILGSLSAAL